MDLFEWLPTECADERYPMQLISGLLHCPNDELVAVPAGKIVNNGWGEVGSRRIVGAQRKGVPQRLTLTWFSYAEDQGFAGEVELPHAELTELFRAGFNDPVTGKRVTWSKIIVGMGLGGATSVWLAGNGLVREVVHTQVDSEDIEWAAVLDNPDIARADFVRSKLRSRLSDGAYRKLVQHGPPVSTWPRYRQRYRWRLLVEGVQVPLNMFLRSFNGDRDFYDFARQPPQGLELVPKHMQITWLTRGGGKLLTKIQLDEQEIYATFDKLGASAPDKDMLLRVDYGTRSQVSLSVELGGSKVALGRANIELASLAG